MNSRTTMIQVDLNVAGRSEPIDVSGFTRMHYQPYLIQGGTLSNAVLEFKRTLFANPIDLESFGTAETITAAEFNSPAITEGIDVADTAFVVPDVTTVEGSDATAAIAVLLTDEQNAAAGWPAVTRGSTFPAATDSETGDRHYHTTHKQWFTFFDSIGDQTNVFVGDRMYTFSYGKNQTGGTSSTYLDFAGGATPGASNKGYYHPNDLIGFCTFQSAAAWEGSVEMHIGGVADATFATSTITSGTRNHWSWADPGNWKTVEPGTAAGSDSMAAYLNYTSGQYTDPSVLFHAHDVYDAT